LRGRERRYHAARALSEARDRQREEPSTEPLSPELVLVDADLARVARERMPYRPHRWAATEADGSDSDGESTTRSLRAAIAAKRALLPASAGDPRKEPAQPDPELVPVEAASPPERPAEPVPQIEDDRLELEDETAGRPKRRLRRALALLMLLVLALLGFAAAKLIREDSGSNLAPAGPAAGAALHARTNADKPGSSRQRAATAERRAASNREVTTRPRSRPPVAASPGKTRLFVWLPVRGASHYRVEFFKGGRKIFEARPLQARLELPERWTYRGRRFRISPGRYRWSVKPGYGSRSGARYARAIVRSAWVVPN
jgi:hypothetical protein